MMRMRFLLSAAVAALAAGAAARADDRAPSDQQVSAEPRGTVEVNNANGMIEVSGWDQPQVSVHSDLTAASNVEVRSERGRTIITVRPHHGFHVGVAFLYWGDDDAHLKIKIPRNSELDVTAVSANVVSTGVLGRQQLKTVSGSIKADVSGADVEAKTISGDVTLHGDSKPGELHVSSISGSVKLAHGAGDVEAGTVSGDLEVQLDPARSVRARTTSGAMVIKGKLAKDADLDLQTVSGDIRLNAGYEGGYEYEASTFSGNIRNCFKQQVERTSQYAPGERLSGTRGDGAGHVRAKTMSGMIELCDKP